MTKVKKNYFIAFQVYDVMKTDKKNDISEIRPAPDMQKTSVIEFHAATIAVKENIGKFTVTIWRHGNTENQVRVRFVLIEHSFFLVTCDIYSKVLSILQQM